MGPTPAPLPFGSFPCPTAAPVPSNTFQEWEVKVQTQLHEKFPEEPQMIIAETAELECIAQLQANPEAVDHTSSFLANMGGAISLTNACQDVAVAVVNGAEEPPLQTKGFEPNEVHRVNEVNTLQTGTGSEASFFSPSVIIAISVAGAAIVALVFALVFRARRPSSLKQSLIY